MPENGTQQPAQFSEELTQLIDKISRDEGLENTVMDITEASTKGDNYLGQVFRVKIEDRNRNKSIDLVAKSSPTSSIIRAHLPISLFYQRETYAYSSVLPTLYELQCDVPEDERFSYAKYYDAVSTEGIESIVMEDLAVRGFKMYNRQVSFDEKHLEMVIKILARFHAASFVLKDKNPKLFEEFSQNSSRKLEFGENFDLHLNLSKKKCLGEVKDPDIKNRAEEFISDTPSNKLESFLLPEKTHPYNVICHGDCWINNFLFKYENDVVTDLRFVDFQIIRCASPVTDLAYMFFSSTDQNIRTKYYTKMLDLYYEILDLNITRMGCRTSELYPEQVFKDHIEKIMPMGLMTGLMLLPIILCDKENVPDMDLPVEEYDESKYDILLSPLLKKRFNEVIDDSVKYGFI